MIHFNEDELLEYALDTSTDSSRRAEIEAHLAVCPDCRAKLDNIRGDLEIIGSVRPQKTELKIPVRQVQPRFLYRSIRVAALIMFGIAVGAGVSKWFFREPARVIPAYIQLSPLPDSVSGFVAADATGIASNHYRQILGER